MLVHFCFLFFFLIVRFPSFCFKVFMFFQHGFIAIFVVSYSLSGSVAHMVHSVSEGLRFIIHRPAANSLKDPEKRGCFGLCLALDLGIDVNWFLF